MLCIIFTAAAMVAWHYRYAFLSLPENLPSIAGSPFVEKLAEEISVPEPLRGSMEEKKTTLTVPGVVAWTNNQRRQNGQLRALRENTKLNKAAAAKVKDMFERQYFEHDSPDGAGPGDLAKAVNYAYLSIGENLALGNFENDQALVEAWMDSPGHRANILSTKYTEIGVAVGKGMYEGKEIWLAVQEFGRPTADCPAISSELQTSIGRHKSEINAEEQAIKQKKEFLESNDPKTEQEVDAHNEEVRVYNEMVKAYNAKLESLKIEIAEYNEQVSAYNICLEG